MSADEMFAELGYAKIWLIFSTVYVKKSDWKDYVWFHYDFEDKMNAVSLGKINVLTTSFGKETIFKKMKEMGWWGE